MPMTSINAYKLAIKKTIKTKCPKLRAKPKFKQVSVGAGPVVKSHSHWLLFDDDVVTPIDESEVTTYLGMSRENDAGNTDHGYILMYQRETR